MGTSEMRIWRMLLARYVEGWREQLPSRSELKPESPAREPEGRVSFLMDPVSTNSHESLISFVARPGHVKGGLSMYTFERAT